MDCYKVPSTVLYQADCCLTPRSPCLGPKIFWLWDLGMLTATRGPSRDSRPITKS